MHSKLNDEIRKILFRFMLGGIALLFSFGSSGSSVVHAENSGAKNESSEFAKVVGEGGYHELEAKIASTGSARIIVTLEMPFTPIADPASEESQVQVNRIASIQDALLAELAPHNVTDQYKFTHVPQLVMTVDAPALQALLASTLVRSVQEDVPVPPNLDLSVPRIGAPSVWAAGYKGAGIAVAILDTGVDKNHAFISGKTVSEACYSTNSAVASSVCSGGVTDSTAVGCALPYAGNCPTGECDHGTHVAGIAAGKESVSGSPGPGVAPLASIIAIQVFSRFDSESDCGPGNAPCALSYISDQIKGLQRVYALRSTFTIASANLSLGGGQFTSPCDSDSRKLIIDNLKAAGIATVISSGNDGFCGATGAPGCISTAVTVGSTTDADTVASYSNSASFVDVLAPGSSINSSLPGGSYASWNGTSMAAPHVTGAWALLKQARPGDTVDQILASFTSTGLSVTDGKCGSVTKKRINVFEALGGGLPAPILTAEPAVTPSTENTIYWSAVSSNAVSRLEFEAQPAGQTASTSISGMIPEVGVLNTIYDTTTAAMTTHETLAEASEEPVSENPIRDDILEIDDDSEPAEATLPLENPFMPEAEEKDAVSDPEPLAATTIFNETFEGSFPGTSWTLYGSPTWDDTSYDKHGGSWSGWCGDSSLNPANGYTDNMNAWMVYGPFSLADATSASVSFWYKNLSESNFDYFKWMASVNGTNFYGQQISGNQNSWRSQVFDLTDVYTLGDLSGEPQVWIAFIFTSDSSVSGPTYTGAYVDDIVVTKETSGGTADLTPYKPSNWNDKIPIGISQLAWDASHSYTGPYYDNQTLYFNWGSVNQGSATASGYTVHVEVTGTGGGSWNWTNITTPPANWTHLTLDQAVGPLAAGSHTFKVWVDYNSTVSESNESNNYYERTITVGTTEHADLTPYKPSNWNDKIPIGISQLAWDASHSYTGPYYDNQTLYFNWGSVNQGSATASGYTVHVEVTGTGGGSWNWTNITTPPANWTHLTLDQAVGPLAAGSHTFKVWVDYNSTVSESNETNNYYERTIDILAQTVEYYAECANNSSFTSPSNSGWLTQTQWTFTALTPGQTYWYRVKAKSGTSESVWSNVEHSQQEDSLPPNPNPMTWSTQPSPASASSIAMAATTAMDAGSPPVSYYFDFVDSPTGGSGGSSSSWQSSTSYTDTGLQANHQYGYRVKARDSASTPNETGYSSAVYKYTLANVPGTAAFSNVTQTSIRANWTANGNPSGTQYYCENTTQGTNSGWTTQTSWDSSGLKCGQSYNFRVIARNGDGLQTGWTNLGAQSTQACLVAPSVETATVVSSITSNSASSGGNVTSNGGVAVTARGVCWSTSANPTISDSHTSDGTGTGSFISSITGLSPNTTYHVRAYATNSEGTGYGSDQTFTTTPATTLPTVTTTAVSSITSNSAFSGGNVTNDGGAAVTARGVCWSTSANPTTSDSHTSDGAGTGSFTSSITGLSPNTTYHVRAYATNSVGTGYGSEKTFTTTPATATKDELAIDFKTTGIYVYNTGSWNRIYQGVDPEGLCSFGTYLAVDFGTAYGLYVYDAGSWTRVYKGVAIEKMAGFGEKLAVDFGTSYPIYEYDFGTDTWSLIYEYSSPRDKIEALGDKLVVDFKTVGIYVYDAGIWNRIYKGVDPVNIVSFGDKLAIDFGTAYGLYVYEYDTDNWTRIYKGVAIEKMAEIDGDLAIDFGTAYGLYVYEFDTDNWTRVYKGVAIEKMAGFDGNLAVDFGTTYPIYEYDFDTNNWNSIYQYSSPRDELVPANIFD